jgi:prefoldin subunit 5
MEEKKLGLGMSEDDKRIRELEERIKELEMQIEYLKKQITCLGNYGWRM